MGTDIDAAVGVDSKGTITLNDKEYRIAPFGPYLLGEIIGYIKQKKRQEIIATATEMGETSFVTVSEFVTKELGKITEDTFDEYLNDMDVLTHLVYFNLKVWQPELEYIDMGKYFSVDKITETAGKIMDDLPSVEDGEDDKNPPIPQEVISEPVGQQQ